MIPVIVKFAVGLAAGYAANRVVHKIVTNIYAQGYVSGEVQTAKVISQLDSMCYGLAESYADNFVKWEQNPKLYRCRPADMCYELIPKDKRTAIYKMYELVSKENLDKITPKSCPNLKRVHQLLITEQLLKKEDHGILMLYRNENVALDNDILFDLAVKYNVVISYENDVINLRGTHENLKLFMNDFWTNYNLIAMELNKECIPIGYYIPDRISGLN